ncbi:hypothetical protein [Embleya hyalina]|uniref:hypothetical protein n=1 Tax=Embleya hyalina TaxID=516124 RepID=UPI0035306551
MPIAIPRLIEDVECPAEIVATLRDALAPGGRPILSHVSSDAEPARGRAGAAGRQNASARWPCAAAPTSRPASTVSTRSSPRASVRAKTRTAYPRTRLTRWRTSGATAASASSAELRRRPRCLPGPRCGLLQLRRHPQ